MVFLARGYDKGHKLHLDGVWMSINLSTGFTAVLQNVRPLTTIRRDGWRLRQGARGLSAEA